MEARVAKVTVAKETPVAMGNPNFIGRALSIVCEAAH